MYSVITARVLTQVGFVLLCAGYMSSAMPIGGSPHSFSACNLTKVNETVMAHANNVYDNIRQLITDYCELSSIRVARMEKTCEEFGVEQEQSYRPSLPSVMPPCVQNTSDATIKVKTQLNHILMGVRARLNLTDRVLIYEDSQAAKYYPGQYDKPWFCDWPASEDHSFYCKLQTRMRSQLRANLINLENIIKQQLIACEMTADTSPVPHFPEPAVSPSTLRMYGLASMFNKQRMHHLIRAQLSYVISFPY